MTAYLRGRLAARSRLSFALNPYADHTHDRDEWERGWMAENAARMFASLKLPRPPSAQILPHDALTAEQLELVCVREGLERAHLGDGRIQLIQTSERAPVTMLRIALKPQTDPEAA